VFFPADVSRKGAHARLPRVEPGFSQDAGAGLDGRDSRLDDSELSGLSDGKDARIT
jgi:hypothetical protein